MLKDLINSSRRLKDIFSVKLKDIFSVKLKDISIDKKVTTAATPSALARV
ncbi:hypothetical protein Hanom_Chr16g01493591 [Helianthus anomalus]